MAPRWAPQRTREGSVIEAGLNARPRKPHGARGPMQPMLGLYRAVVVNTYAPDAIENRQRYQVECDVVLATSMLPLARVPVQQASYGVNNAQPWCPKPSTRSVTTGRPLNLRVASRRGTFVAPATALDDLDGDHVIIQFVEGSLDYPIITGAFTHRRTKRRVRQTGTGWRTTGAATTRGTPHKDESYLVHQGTEFRINERGDLLIDSVGAHTDPVAEVPGPTGGAIRIRVKGTETLIVEMDGTDALKIYRDGPTVKVDIADTPTQAFVKGNDQQAAINQFSLDLDTWANAVAAAFTALGSPLGPPHAAFIASSASFRTAVLAALSTQIRGK